MVGDADVAQAIGDRLEDQDVVAEDLRIVGPSADDTQRLLLTVVGDQAATSDC